MADRRQIYKYGRASAEVDGPSRRVFCCGVEQRIGGNRSLTEPRRCIHSFLSPFPSSQQSTRISALILFGFHSMRSQDS